MDPDGLSCLVVTRKVEHGRKIVGESEAPARKKKTKEKEKSTVMQSVTHGTNPHPSLEHRPILTVQLSGFA